MMRDLILAFSAAARDRMTAAGWRKRSGDIYTLDLSEGHLAWLGLNRATKYHPLEINPVMGLRYDPLERLLAELQGRAHDPTTATLSSPIGYLTPANTFLQLQIATEQDARPAADQLHDLVQEHGLPFARRLANLDEIEHALREGDFEGNPEQAKLYLPALLLHRGRHAQARASLADGLAAYADHPEWPVSQHYRTFADALTARLETR